MITDSILSNIYSRYDKIFVEPRKRKLCICPLGGTTKIMFDDMDKSDNIEFIADKNSTEKEMFGYPVISYKELMKADKECDVMILSARHYDSIYSELLEVGVDPKRILPYTCLDTRIHPNYSNSRYTEWLQTNTDRLNMITTMMEDELSKKHLKQALIGAENISLAEWLDVGRYSETEDPDYFNDYDFLKLSDHECYLDVGAYDGDSVRLFLNAVKNEYESIVAVEPDKDNYVALIHNCKEIRNIHCYNKGLGEKKGRAVISQSINGNISATVLAENGDLEIVPIDSLDFKFTIIKISLHGTQLKREILMGGKDHIKREKPIIIVQIGNYTDEIMEIPEIIRSINPMYRFHFRVSITTNGQKAMKNNYCLWAI